MGTRVFNNKRTHDTNIQKNSFRVPEGQAFTLPSDIVQDIREKDAIVAALQVFQQITERGLKLPDRDFAADEDLLVPAQRVLGRLT